MTQHNPYAPSKAALAVRGSAGSGNSTEVWRDGKWLVMDRDASLPPRCVKCNEPAHEPVKARRLYWHHPAIYFLLLLNIIIYVVVAAIVRKTIRIEPALCTEHGRKRRNVLLTTGLGLAGSVVLPFAAAGVVTDVAGIVVLAVLMFLGFSIYGIFAARIVYAKKIDENEARLGGCGEDYLASLPDYPY